jgi:hypothetical protein
MRRLIIALLLAACGSDGSARWKKQDVPMAGLSAYALWVAGENDVWLGGTALWHYDGSAWTEHAAMPVVDFWGFGPDDIWAINDAHVFHWDGAAWTEVPPTAGVTFDSMWRIWASSSTDVYVANQNNSRVYRYNGTSWTVTTLQFVMADALWGSSASDIWLSGTTSLYHYTGTWQRYDGNDEPPSVYGLWGFGPDDVWAAGSFDGLSHWNGSTWTAADEEEVEESYNAVWGSASDHVIAVGDNGAVAELDGSSWSESRDLYFGTNFTTIHGSSATNVWATAVDLENLKALVFRFEP